jgi:poly-gamma-glutamate synthesis protein (capsule biosynthesis protein)
LRDTPIRKIGSLQKGTPADARVIADCGFTHIGLSNNHTLDYGVAGMRDTVDAVRAAGMIPFGYGENDTDSRAPLYLEKDGTRIAVVAVCEHEYTYALPDQFGANPFDPFDTMQDIADAKKNADAVIVMYHGGKEQCEYPSPRLRRACRAMVRAGADLVLTQHSHCIGCRETYRGAQIVYGEGNFNFVGHSDHPHWKNGLMIDARFGDAVELSYLPVVVTETGITLAHGAQKDEILEAFEARSRTLLDDAAWNAAWEAFCASVPYYRDAVKNAYVDVPEGEECRQVFPHYLDCEAHLDVWKTIYRTWHAEKRTEI